MKVRPHVQPDGGIGWFSDDRPPKPDPVGAVEIAERLKVKRNTVDIWRQRDLGFPEPRWTVGGRPAWDWPDVEAWQRSRAASPITS